MGDSVKPATVTSARASSADLAEPPCRCACAKLGAAFAELLEEPHSHQLGVCARLRIVWRTHMRWLATDAEPGSDLEDYQQAVLTALDKQRRLDMENGQSAIDAAHPAKAGAQFNMFKFSHENRFRRFYGDEDKQRIEVTGKDGGPIESSSTVRYVVAVPQEESEDQET